MSKKDKLAYLLNPSISTGLKLKWQIFLKTALHEKGFLDFSCKPVCVKKRISDVFTYCHFFEI